MELLNTQEELLKHGIYRIYCKGNNKSYIGSASSTKSKTKTRNGFIGRYKHHVRFLKENKHRNSYLQNAYNFYGLESFTFEILLFCKPEECDLYEIPYMDKYESMIYQNGFNIIRQPLSNYNGNFSEEHCRKISESLKGRKRPIKDVKRWSTAVEQYDKEGNFIAEYYSMSEASRITGIQRQDIGQSIIGRKCKTAGGFIWKKKDKDIV